MKSSEWIAALEHIIAEHGDVEVLGGDMFPVTMGVEETDDGKKYVFVAVEGFNG